MRGNDIRDIQVKHNDQIDAIRHEGNRTRHLLLLALGAIVYLLYRLTLSPEEEANPLIAYVGCLFFSLLFTGAAQLINWLQYGRKGQ